MKLGLWNRLAIVATVLAVIVVPLWIVVRITGDITQSREALYDLCLGFARDGPPDELAAALDQCWQDRIANPYHPTMADWAEFAGGTLIACAVIYGLIWLVVWTARWVWRGRSMD